MSKCIRLDGLLMRYEIKKRKRKGEDEVEGGEAMFKYGPGGGALMAEVAGRSDWMTTATA